MLSHIYKSLYRTLILCIWNCFSPKANVSVICLFYIYTCSNQITVFVNGLFALNQDFLKFKLHLRDFLIQLKEFAEDNADLYIDEREAESERQKQAEIANALKVPGLVKPADLPMEEE